MDDMEENNRKEVIDLREVFKKMWHRKKTFLLVWLVTFVLSCAIILPVPRTYQAAVSVAPESAESQGGTLSSIASSFGFNIGTLSSTDAFYPDIYPDVMASNNFIAELMAVHVTSIDGTIDTDYYTYLKNFQKKTFYMVPINWTKRTIKNWLESKPTTVKPLNTGDTGINPVMLSEEQQSLFEAVRDLVTCSVDKKTGIITINVTDQDPLICASMADSARVRLQEFITRYRTSKARVDYEYYLKLTNDAKAEYEEVSKAYGAYCDSHLNTILQSELSVRDELENELSMKLTAYNTLNTQLVAAKAKIQERTPAFSLLESPTVPVRPTGPKRMIFVAGMMFLAFIGTTLYIFKDSIISQLLGKRSEKLEVKS